MIKQIARRSKQIAATSQPKSGMRVIVLASTKGGVGKSTLSATLAVRAARDGGRVALIDCDPQQSLSSWWDRRQQPDNPKLFEGVDAAQEAIELIASEGWDWIIIDTPPAMLDKIEPAILSADLVLIPVRASALDVEAVRLVEELCLQHNRPYAFVLNQVMPGWAINASAVAYLSTNRRTILQPHVQLRQSHAAAMTVGKSAAEVDKTKAVRDEIDGLWESVKAHVARVARPVQ